MPEKNKLGTKWTCIDCEAKFYDLAKPEAICPKCGTNQNAPKNESDDAE